MECLIPKFAVIKSMLFLTQIGSEILHFHWCYARSAKSE